MRRPGSTSSAAATAARSPPPRSRKRSSAGRMPLPAPPLRVDRTIRRPTGRGGIPSATIGPPMPSSGTSSRIRPSAPSGCSSSRKRARFPRRERGPSDAACVATAGAFQNLLHGDRTGYVHMMAVLPEFRRRGLGAALLGRCLLYFREQGWRDAVLDTDVTRLPAIRLYLAHGFEPFPEVEADVEKWRTVLAVAGKARPRGRRRPLISRRGSRAALRAASRRRCGRPRRRCPDRCRRGRRRGSPRRRPGRERNAARVPPPGRRRASRGESASPRRPGSRAGRCSCPSRCVQFAVTGSPRLPSGAVSPFWKKTYRSLRVRYSSRLVGVLPEELDQAGQRQLLARQKARLHQQRRRRSCIRCPLFAAYPMSNQLPSGSLSRADPCTVQMYASNGSFR